MPVRGGGKEFRIVETGGRHALAFTSMAFGAVLSKFAPSCDGIANNRIGCDVGIRFILPASDEGDEGVDLGVVRGKAPAVANSGELSVIRRNASSRSNK